MRQKMFTQKEREPNVSSIDRVYYLIDDIYNDFVIDKIYQYVLLSIICLRLYDVVSDMCINESYIINWSKVLFLINEIAFKKSLQTKSTACPYKCWLDCAPPTIALTSVHLYPDVILIGPTISRSGCRILLVR